MITNKIIAPHIIRLYCWEILQQETGMSKINSLVPILPVEDEPKVSESGMTYAIYGYAENESAGDNNQIRYGTFSLRVIGKTYAELTQLINVISLAFESTDIATEALNRFSSRYPGAALEGIRFTFAKTSYIEGGEAAETEGGPVDGIVNVSYRYINRIQTPVLESIKGGLWT